MRIKAIQDLSQLSDKDFFAEIAVGSALCIKNAKKIHADSLTLADLEALAGAEILRLAAEEEAGITYL